MTPWRGSYREWLIRVIRVGETPVNGHLAGVYHHLTLEADRRTLRWDIVSGAYREFRSRVRGGERKRPRAIEQPPAVCLLCGGDLAVGGCAGKLQGVTGGTP